MILSDRKTLIELRAVGKSYGSAQILQGIDLTIQDGEFLVILGPSGSGKTTILRLIGGFTGATTGEICLDGKVINNLPINRRPFNTVFQDYALFPHMTVRDNVAYGLSVRRLAKAEITRQTDNVLDLVSLSALSQRYPAELSGGQRQRVALARAIICAPRLVLLDEPLAALDVDLRRQMQVFLKQVQARIKTTFVFITHDQEEAITLADRICVMDHGRIVQVGPPRDLYDRPQTAHVARFFGENNLIEGQITGFHASLAQVDTALGTLQSRFDPDACFAVGDKVLLALRPEKLRLTGDQGLSGHIAGSGFSGPLTHLSFTPDAAPQLSLTLKHLSTSATDAQGAARITWSPADTWLVRA